MAAGHSLHLGVNSNDAFKLGFGSFPTLAGCDLAAGAMRAIAESRGYSRSVLLIDREATRDNVLGWLQTTAAMAKPADIVLITFAGHGTVIRHRNGDERVAQAVVLYDGTLRDDRLHEAMGRFASKVRVVLVADSCFSGSIVAPQRWVAGGGTGCFAPVGGVWGAVPLNRRDRANPRPPLGADVLLLAATSESTKVQGASRQQTPPPFTAALVAAFRAKSGNFPGGYQELIQDIAGDALLNRELVKDEAFVAQQPFEI